VEKLAIDGGKPVSDHKVPLAKPIFSQKDADDIAKVLKSGYVRQGPYTKEFEAQVAANNCYNEPVSRDDVATYVKEMMVLFVNEDVNAITDACRCTS
jgi:dTDP-4-amino-4,6-dideoxygalactose transaminase